MMLAKHDIYYNKKQIRTIAGMVALFDTHDCGTQCAKFVTLFEPYNTIQTEALRLKQYRDAKQDIKKQEKDRYQERIKDEGFKNRKSEQQRARYNELKFPPPAPSKDQVKQIINNYCKDIAFDNLQEFGCAVCGALTPSC